MTLFPFDNLEPIPERQAARASAVQVDSAHGSVAHRELAIGLRSSCRRCAGGDAQEQDDRDDASRAAGDAHAILPPPCLPPHTGKNEEARRLAVDQVVSESESESGMQAVRHVRCSVDFFMRVGGGQSPEPRGWHE